MQLWLQKGQELKPPPETENWENTHEFKEKRKASVMYKAGVKKDPQFSIRVKHKKDISRRYKDGVKYTVWKMLDYCKTSLHPESA